MKLLHVDSSILGEKSVSRELSAAIVKRLQRENPRLELVTRDLERGAVSHLSGAHLAAAQQGSADKTIRSEVETGAAMLQEFLDADIVVIGAPMYNFGIPSSLKAWIDRLAVKDKTFAYSESGPKGLATGKRVIIASSRGNIYAPGTTYASFDLQESYLRVIFGFFGIVDVEIIRAEGVNRSPAQRQQAMEAAMATIASLTEKAPAHARGALLQQET